VFIFIQVNDYVDLLLMEIRKIADGSETYSPSLRVMQKELGMKVYSRCLIKNMKNNGTYDKLVILYKEYCDWYLNRNENIGEFNPRRKWQQLIHDNRDSVSLV